MNINLLSKTKVFGKFKNTWAAFVRGLSLGGIGKQHIDFLLSIPYKKQQIELLGTTHGPICHRSLKNNSEWA